MKTKNLIIILTMSTLLFGTITSTIAQCHSSSTGNSTMKNHQMPEKNSLNKTDTIAVNGECGMCKSKIEGSINNQKGIVYSNWNQDTKMLIVTYNPEMISIDQISQKIADVGYDTERVKAKDETYNHLPQCCQYVRK